LQRFINKTVLKQSKQTMKKFQMMMATLLVALMAFAVQSCGSDDKDDL